MVVVMIAFWTEAAQFVRFAGYADIRSVVIHARYLGFLYPFLFIIGMKWLWDLWLRRQRVGSLLLSLFLSLDMAAFTYYAMKLLWLPPTF